MWSRLLCPPTFTMVCFIYSLRQSHAVIELIVFIKACANIYLWNSPSNDDLPFAHSSMGPALKNF